MTSATLDRTKSIGGSDAPVIVGCSPYKTAFQLYHEKRGTWQPPSTPTASMQWGTLLEDPIAFHYANITDRKVRRRPCAIHPEYPWMRAHIDRQIVGDPRGPGILEVKTTNQWSGKGIQGIDDLPDHYYIQLQHYLAVYGYDWGSLALLVGGQHFLWFDVTRNDPFIDVLIAKEVEFWDRVATGTPPPVDATDTTTDVLHALYPKDSGRVVSLNDPDVRDAAVKLREAKHEAKRLEAEITRHENVLKDAMRDATEAKIEGFGRITWRTATATTREQIDRQKLATEFPDAYAACHSTETKPGSRRFLLRPYTDADGQR